MLLGLLGVWIVLSIYLGVGLSSVIAERGMNKYSEITEMPISSAAQTLFVKSSSTIQLSDSSMLLFGKFLFPETNSKNREIYGITKVSVRYENIPQAFLHIEKIDFQNNSAYPSLNVDIQDSVLYIPSVFAFKNNVWNGERLRITIVVPSEKQVIFDKGFKSSRYIESNRRKCDD